MKLCWGFLMISLCCHLCDFSLVVKAEKKERRRYSEDRDIQETQAWLLRDLGFSYWMLSYRRLRQKKVEEGEKGL